ncbi:MAG TPA: metal ABC transporter permease [Acidimicrobiales bacterium]|nr:metal ABC transporter permease [Acidimicrobiales bacterium]
MFSGLFSGFMVNTWLEASVMAVVAGAVGFFVVLRGSSFEAHAIPQGAFTGAAGAGLIGANTLLGVGTFCLLGVVAISRWGRRGQHDVVTALSLITLLGIGSLFLSMSTEYSEQTFSLLFGEPLAVSSSDLLPTALLGAGCMTLVVLLFRPLMLSSVAPELAAARGIRPARIELLFLLAVGVATTMALPVVGALLVFSLMIGPPATARFVTDRPARAMVVSGALGLVTVWVSITAAFWSNWPIGFFVGTFAVVWYVIGRCLARWRRKPGPGVVGARRHGVAVGSTQ